MRWTGAQNCNLYEVKNFRFETVESLPLFLPEYIGRVLYVSTLGPEFGVYVGTEAGWLKIGDSPNKANLTLEYRVVDYDTTQTDPVSIYEASGLSENVPVPLDSQLIMLCVRSSEAITQGSILVRPTINGQEVETDQLDVVLNTSYPVFNKKRVLTNLPELWTPASGTVGLNVYGSLDTLPTEINILAYLVLKLPLIIDLDNISENAEFTHWGIEESQEVNMFLSGGGFENVYAPQDGYILGCIGILDPQRSAGELEIIPTINGSEISDTRLHLLFDQSNPLRQAKSTEKDAEYFFNEGDLVSAAARL